MGPERVRLSNKEGKQVVNEQGGENPQSVINADSPEIKKSLKKPWLIQRGEIDGYGVDKSISQNVEWDYMGSAEFEMGELPKSNRRIQYYFQRGKYQVIESKRIKSKGKPMTYFTKLDEEALDKYDEMIALLWNDDREAPRTKEVFRYKKSDTDIWWDIDNDIIFSPDAKFMRNIEKYFTNTIKKLEGEA